MPCGRLHLRHKPPSCREWAILPAPSPADPSALLVPLGTPLPTSAIVGKGLPGRMCTGQEHVAAPSRWGAIMRGVAKSLSVTRLGLADGCGVGSSYSPMIGESARVVGGSHWALPPPVQPPHHQRGCGLASAGATRSSVSVRYVCYARAARDPQEDDFQAVTTSPRLPLRSVERPLSAATTGLSALATYTVLYDSTLPPPLWLAACWLYPPSTAPAAPLSLLFFYFLAPL